MRPRGRSVSRSGAPSQPGEINFRQRPPCVFTADASLRSIRDSRICTPPRSLRPSAVKSWSGAKLVRGVLPLTYFAHSLTASATTHTYFYIMPLCVYARPQRAPSLCVCDDSLSTIKGKSSIMYVYLSAYLGKWYRSEARVPAPRRWPRHSPEKTPAHTCAWSRRTPRQAPPVSAPSPAPPSARP